MSENITPSPAFARRRPPSSSGTSYGVPSPTPFCLRALKSPPNPKRQALEEVCEQRRLLSGSSAGAFFMPNSGGRPRRESGAFSSHRLGNFLPSYRSLGGEYLAERCGTCPEGVSRAVREGNASITLLGGGGRAVVSVPDGLIIWEVCAWGDSDAEGSLAPIFHISHPGLDTPVNAKNVKLASCGTTLLAASPNAHVRVWKDPKRFPRSSSDFSLPLAQDAEGSNDEEITHTIASVVALGEDDFFIGSSRGEIWRFFPSISHARKLQWSVNEERRSSPVGLLSRFMGLRSNPTLQENEKCSDELDGEINDKVVTMLILNLLDEQLLLLVFMKKGGIKAWNVNANEQEEVPEWSYSPPDSQWNGSEVLDAKLIECREGEVLMLCAPTPAASSVEGSEGESCKRPHKLFLNHIRVTTCQKQQGQEVNGSCSSVSFLNHIPIDGFNYSGSNVDSTTTSLVVEPLGSSSTCFTLAHFWRLNCPDGDVAVTTVDFTSKDGRHITNSHDYRTTKFVLPPSVLHHCIGGGLRPPFGPGILLFNEKGNMVAVSRLGGDGITTQQDRKQGRLITTTLVNVKPDPYEIGGPCISVDTCNVSPSSDLGREWAELLETAYLAYERNGDALTPLQPILEGDPLGIGGCILVEAVRDVSEALLDSEPILPPNSAIDEVVHVSTARSPNIIAGNDEEEGIGRKGEGSGGNTTVLVHQALAVKAKRHRSFVGFLHSTMLWSAIGSGQAASILASHGEQLSAAIVLCGAQGRVSQLLHHESFAHLLCHAEVLALKARGIDIEALRNAGVSPTLAFFTRVSKILDLFLHIEYLPEFDPLLVDVSEVLVAMLDATAAHRLKYESMYEAGIAARPWTSERMVRDVIIRQLQLHASSRGTSRGRGGTGEDAAGLSIVWDPKLSGVVLRLASVLLGGFQEQKEMMGCPPAGREQQQWQDSYNAAKKVAMVAVRMACQPADGWNLALEHECFESLLRIAIQAEDQQPGSPERLNALRQLMKTPPGGPTGGFQEFLLSSLLSERREADVLELGAAVAPELLQDILSSSGESKLLWMNWVKCERYTEATGNLLNLAKLESNSLLEKHTLLSLAKLSHLSAGGSSLAEKGDLEMLAEIDDALCITASQKNTLGGGEVDAHVKEWEDVVHQCIDQVVMLYDENRGMTEGALLAANAGLSVVDVQHRLGMRSNKMNKKFRESLVSAAARIWEVIIKQSLDQPDVKNVLSRLASNSIVSDQEVEHMWKTGGSLLHLTLSSIDNTEDTTAIEVINNNPSQLTDDMIWNSLALAYPGLKRPKIQQIFNLIGKAR